MDGERKKAEKLAEKLRSEQKKAPLRAATPDPRAARVSEQEFRLEVVVSEGDGCHRVHRIIADSGPPEASSASSIEG